MAFDETTTVASPTGAALRLYAKRPAGRLRGVVQINHGLAEHAMRYARFAMQLASQGFAAYAHDHRGHGHTTAPGAPLGSFGPEPMAENVIADVAAVHDEIRRRHPDIPVIVFGHSMGALIAMNFVLRHSEGVAGAAIWNGNFSAGLLGRLGRVVLAWETFRIGSDVPTRILPRLTFQAWARQVTDGRTDFDWLSRDIIEVDAYIADPLCGWNASVGMWKAVFDLVFSGADNGRLEAVRHDLPFNLVGGGADPESERGKTVIALGDRLRRHGFCDVTTTIYPDARHESLNEVNREQIMGDFVAWSKRVTREWPLLDKGSSADETSSRH